MMRLIFLYANLLLTASVQAGETTTRMNSQIVIAFDLHEVVVTFSYTKFFNALYDFFKKNPYALTLANPIASYRFFKTYSTVSRTAENVYDTLTREYYPWLADSREEFIKICNSYVIDPHMQELLMQLKQQGYRLATCSNIGHHAFTDFVATDAEFFDHFEAMVTSHPEQSYQRKPAPEFFERLKVRCCTNNQCPEPERYIFVDDKKKNVQAAQGCGMQGIVFKNHRQLRKELKKFGVHVT